MTLEKDIEKIIDKNMQNCTYESYSKDIKTTSQAIATYIRENINEIAEMDREKLSTILDWIEKDQCYKAPEVRLRLKDYVNMILSTASILRVKKEK